MTIQSQIDKLDEVFTTLTSELGGISGQENLLKEQVEDLEIKLQTLTKNKEVYTKAVELLTLVQQETREQVKDGFEKIVTHALRYIFNEDYSFELEFGRRGNLQELDFNVKTPHCQEPLDPLSTSGGTILDILSLALRVSLLELSKPKLEGFLILDEPFKHVSSKHVEAARKFLDVIAQKINRQIIMISHKKELITSRENVIEVK